MYICKQQMFLRTNWNEDKAKAFHKKAFKIHEYFFPNYHFQELHI